MVEGLEAVCNPPRCVSECVAFYYIANIVVRPVVQTTPEGTRATMLRCVQARYADQQIKAVAGPRNQRELTFREGVPGELFFAVGVPANGHYLGNIPIKFDTEAVFGRGKHNLFNHAAAYGLSRREADDAIRWATELAGLRGMEDEISVGLSGTTR